MWLGLTNHFDILTIRDISDSRYISNRDIVVQLYSKLCISNTLRELLYHHIIQIIVYLNQISYHKNSM